MMRKNIYRVSVLLTVLVLLVTYTVSYALSQRTNFKAVPSEVTEWTTYTDPRFDFSVSIPATWILSPREDRPGTIGERLVISAPVSGTNQGELGSTKIEIGLYLVERELEQPLLNWSELYDANHDEFDASRILVLATEKRTQQNQDAYYKAAISPLTAYTYVNIPYGNVVWGIWMNSINEEYQNVLKHIADSISFGKNA